MTYIVGSMRGLIVSLLGFGLVFGGGLHAAPSASRAVVEALPDHARWAALPRADGGLVVAYYDDLGHLTVTQDGERIFDSREEYGVGALSGIALAESNGALWWAFRPKEPRQIALRSTSGARAEVDGTSLPLPRLALLPGDNGSVEVFWTGERPLAQSTGGWAVARAAFSADGAPLGMGDVLPGELPMVAQGQDGTRLVVTNHAYESGGTVSAWVYRQGVASVTEVAQGVHAVQPTGAFVDGKRMFAYWNNETERLDAITRLELAFSDDGSNWEQAALPWPAEAYANHVRIASDGEGSLILAAFAGVLDEAEQRKDTVLLFRSADAGATWDGPVVHRLPGFEYSKQGAADVLRLDDGRLLVMWTDWRYTRPSLRYGLIDGASGDWVVEDAPFASPADTAAALSSFADTRSVFVLDGDLVAVAEVPDDSFAHKSLKVLSRPLAELAERLPEADAPDLERLAERVNAFGRAFVEQRFEDAYAFFDPYYRARVSLRDFMDTQGRIAYKSYEFVEHGDAAGSVATAKVRIVAGVPQFASGAGGRFEAEEREMESVGRWLWVDGDWYREFFSSALEKRFARF